MMVGLGGDVLMFSLFRSSCLLLLVAQLAFDKLGTCDVVGFDEACGEHRLRARSVVGRAGFEFELDAAMALHSGLARPDEPPPPPPSSSSPAAEATASPPPASRGGGLGRGAAASEAALH